MNNTCCDNCKRWRGYMEGGKPVDIAYCVDNACPCHNKRVSMKEAFEIASNLGSVPTQPEDSWEERFDREFPTFEASTFGELREGIERISTYPNRIKSFIRAEIEAAAERGYKLCEKDTKDDYKVKYGLGLEKGRRDAMDELEGKLPEGEDASCITENIVKNTAAVLNAYLAEGSNRYRTTVLNIIKSIKGE